VSPTFRSLRVRNYRLYFAGALVSNTGTWMQRVAQDWLVLQLSGSGTAVGITIALQFLPMVLFGLWGGVLADRLPKRRLLMASQAFLGLQALTLGLLVISGAAQVWHVYVLALLMGIGTAVDNPTRQSFVVEMVDRDDLPNAVALNSSSFNGARLLGPAVAGVLIAAIGTGPVFLINAASFLAVILGLWRMRPDELRPSPRVPRGKGQLREGLRYLLARPDLLLPVVIVFFVGTFGMNFQLTLVLFADRVFHQGADGFGLLSSALAVGTLSGALLAARRARPRMRIVVMAAVTFGALEMITGLMPTYWTFAVMLVPTGMALLTMITTANASIQLRVSAAMRGRVMALYMMVFFGGTLIGAPIIGWLAEQVGPRSSLLAGGAISAIATVVATAVLARRQGLVIRAHVRPRPHFHVREPELSDQVGSA
jgi:MFS family permease